MRFTRLVRYSLYVLAVLIVLPVIQEVPIEVARSFGLYDFEKQGFFKKLSDLAQSTTYIISVTFVFGMAAGATLHWVAARIENRRPAKKTAKLVLNLPADSSVPSMSYQSNVWRWFWFTYIVLGIDQDGQERTIGEAPVLFINFDQEVAVTSLRVRSYDCTLPIHEVKEFKSRFAIIYFKENFGPATLEIEVVQQG